MSRSSALIIYSSSIITGETTEWNIDTHFRWHSIRRFISIATTMSSAAFNFDLFSNITTKVRLLEFLILESTVGISYLCMDSFIKLYTRRYDCNKYLNPLLRGISYGQWVQTGYFSLLHGALIADTVWFIAGAFKEVPSWTLCASDVNLTCIPMKDVLLRCHQNRTTAFRNTSVFFYYMNYFTYGSNRNTTTSRLFMTAIAWILAFLVSSVTDETIIKIFRLTNAFSVISTIVTIIFLLYGENPLLTTLADIVDMSAESTWALSMQHMAYSYGIGFLGIYDYGAISPYTMIDTASILFMIFFTTLTFMRSFIIKILYLRMKKCVVIDDSYVITTHNLLYAVLPSTTEFFSLNKLFLLYILGNLAVTLISFETFLISTMSKFLQYQFRNVKQIYIVGMICTTGFTITVIHIAVSIWYGKRHYITAEEREVGVDILALYLSGFRVAIIMWLYGVKLLATDIHFWLGFHPAKFWIISWSVLPLVLVGFFINKCLLLLKTQITPIKDLILIISTVLLVTGFQIKTIAGYLIKNNIVGIFIANKLYGPPESEDRKRRQFYNEVTRRRKCVHNCMIIDEWFSCDHVLNAKGSAQTLSEEQLLRNIKKATESREVQP